MESDMRRPPVFVAGLLIVAVVALASGQERINQDAYWKIRQEGTSNSHVLRTTQVLTDVYGPRLTGSPNLKAAGEWAIKQLESWGLKNGHLEPWDFGRPGWLNERLSAHIVSPVKDHLVAEALAWTPSTNGPVRAAAVQIVLPQRPTKEDLTSYFDKVRASVKGKIVLIGEPQRVSVSFNPPALRREDSDVLTGLSQPPAQTPARGGPPPQAAQTPEQSPVLTNNQITQQLWEFLVTNGVVARVLDAGRDHGQIRAFQNSSYDPTKAVPTVVMRNEDYGRISRLLGGSQNVELEFDIVNRIYPEGKTAYNAIAEIPGSDRADEVVMLGGHLDSWHAATGATDNAIGCAVMMEAARILAAIGVKPRRTIRVALWSGEEQGLLGSRAYVSQHFGMVEEPKPDHARLAAYFNLDSGTGRVRGMTVFGPPAAGTILREAIAPFKDLGALGAATTRSRQGSNSDFGSFNASGLPGISILQDPIQYGSYTWHSNLDTYERIVEDDVIKAAIVIAAAVYHVSMRDEPLPRFTKEEMPRRPQQAPTPTQTPAATAPPAQAGQQTR
jgi:carboxypeptidase Q